MKEIKFVSYTGKWPNLCRGVLTVKIDGKAIKFGHDSMEYDYKTDSYLDEDPKEPNYEAFWLPGGIIKTENLKMVATKDDWVLNDDPKIYKDYPKNIKKVLKELIKLFNENVEPGCCGGCI